MPRNLSGVTQSDTVIAKVEPFDGDETGIRRCRCKRARQPFQRGADYFIFYDDTVYGEDDRGEGGNGGWGDLVTRYIGIVREVNIFNGDATTGAVIIKYLEGCYPRWSWDVLLMPLPFFGIYYRVIQPDRILMANPVDLEALSSGKAYYTETATLQEAIDKNNAENESKFVAGVGIAQDRAAAR